MSILPGRRRAHRTVLCVRQAVATIRRHRGGQLVDLGEAGALDIDLSSAISLRDALTALIAQRCMTTGGIPCQRH